MHDMEADGIDLLRVSGEAMVIPALMIILATYFLFCYVGNLSAKGKSYH